MSNPIRLPDINVVILAGRVTADVKLRSTTSGTPVMDFNVAHNRRYQDKSGEWTEATTFMAVTVFGKAAERLRGRVLKGTAVVIWGRLDQREWTDKQGSKRSSHFVSASRVQVLDKAEPQASREATSEAPSDGEETDDISF